MNRFVPFQHVDEPGRFSEEEQEERERDRNGGRGAPGTGSGRCRRHRSFHREGLGSGTQARQHVAAARPAFPGARSSRQCRPLRCDFEGSRGVRASLQPRVLPEM